MRLKAIHEIIYTVRGKRAVAEVGTEFDLADQAEAESLIAQGAATAVASTQPVKAAPKAKAKPKAAPKAQAEDSAADLL